MPLVFIQPACRNRQSSPEQSRQPSAPARPGEKHFTEDQSCCPLRDMATGEIQTQGTSTSQRDGHIREKQRFTMLFAVDMGVQCRVMAAKDAEFQNAAVCIASIPKDETMMQWFKTKLMAHCRLHHPHVLKYYDVFLSGNEVHVLFEFPKGNSLLSILSSQKLTEDHARYIFQQLVFAVDYFHRMGLKGLDLLLESIFLSAEDGLLKIADFGFHSQTESGVVYSLPYISPELIMHPADGERFRQESDVWSLGVLLYCLLFRRFPFSPSDDTSKAGHVQNILRVNWTIPRGESASVECVHLLERIFTPRPTERITLSEIKFHPWYQKELPVGVLSYQDAERPQDGLLKKVENIERILCAQPCDQPSH